MNSGPLWLDILCWALAGLAAWLVLGALVGLAVSKFIAFGERERPRHVEPRVPRQRRPAAPRSPERRLSCRPDRPCRLCDRAACTYTPCCPHCPWDPTNDQM